ncbi:MAG: adenosylcobinamide amidohydrolase [Methanolinea sp.]|jgi:adenosylcobinamide hydrolase|nr:adenosylcobinamide amidohydrolase [Methanolinea sp.]
MDYHWSSTTLVVEGDFLAASTGVGGGISRVSALFNHTVPRDWHEPDPLSRICEIARNEQIKGSFFGLLTAVPIHSLVICRSGPLTVFITAGISGRTINIIAVSREGMSENALLESIATIASAKTAALLRSGRDLLSTPTDATIMACEGPLVHRYAGIVTPVGKELVKCVERGVPLALARYEGGAESPLEWEMETGDRER